MSRIILKSGKKLAPLFTQEDSMKLYCLSSVLCYNSLYLSDRDGNGTWTEGSLIVGKSGIADKRKFVILLF